MEAYQFSFDRVEKNYDISEGDGQWARVDLNPAMSYYQLRDMMRVLVQRFPPAATVVLNFPVWQNTSDARYAVLWITHMFAEKRPVDVSVYFPCATAEEVWVFVHAMHDNVVALEIACEQRVDGVGDLWAARPRLEKLAVVPAADGPACVFLRKEAE